MNFDDFENKTFHVNNNPDNLDSSTLEKVNELRDQRNTYSEKARECQEEIDRIILEYNNFDDLIGKYLEINYPQSEDNNVSSIVYCGPITKVDRLYKSSCRVYASKFIKKYNYEEQDFNLKLYTNYSMMISKNNFNVKNYKEISKETFLDILDAEVLKFKQEK
jgi:hypothetical protein